MNKIRVIFCIGLLFTVINNTSAQSRYNLIFEPDFGMNFGAENIAAAHYLWRSFDNHYIPTQLLKKDIEGKKLWNRAYRLGKLFMIDYPMTFVLPSIQHERFGHGSRTIEFGGKIDQVKISLPPPFQATFPGIYWISPNLETEQEDLIKSIGGSEANIILSNILRKNILLDDELDYHNALLYLYSNNDLSGYSAFAANIGGSDLTRYENVINNYYGNNNLKLGKIQLYGVLSILSDPINYYSFNSIFNGYIWNGNKKSKIHLIPISENLKYLPKFNFILTPYGPELKLQNYFKHNEKLYNLSFGFSDGTFANSWRLSAEAWNLKLNNKFSFNFSTQLWNQPNIDYYVDDQLRNAAGLGGAFIVNTNYDFYTKENILGLTIQLGHKSKGFAIGERLDEGLIIRGGLSFRIKE